MAQSVIGSKIEQIKTLLERLRQYDYLIAADNFEPSTVKDMKGNSKDICDQAKDLIDEVKDNLDQWE